jgi:hypothetical protein
VFSRSNKIWQHIASFSVTLCTYIYSYIAYRSNYRMSNVKQGITPLFGAKSFQALMTILKWNAYTHSSSTLTSYYYKDVMKEVLRKINKIIHTACLPHYYYIDVRKATTALYNMNQEQKEAWNMKHELPICETVPERRTTSPSQKIQISNWFFRVRRNFS